MARLSNQGHFVWRDLITPDPAAAETFYTALFGWTVQHRDVGAGDVFRIIELDGVPFGAIQPPRPGAANAFWNGYIGTPDADGVVSTAASLGATVQIAPGNLPGFGRFGVIADPHGAIFAPITGEQPGPDPDADIPLGGVSWRELITPDVTASVAFYSRLFGYETADDSPGDGSFEQLQRTENGATHTYGSVFAADGSLPTGWVSYIRVADLDAACAQAISLGATRVTDIIDVEGFGRSCCITDPTGALIGLHQTAP